MPRRAHDFRALTQPTRLRLLREVQRAPGRRADELAEAVGVPLNTVRDHLRVLEDEGLVLGERLRTGGRGRPPIAYRAVQGAQDAAASAPARVRVAGAERRGSLLRAVSAASASASTSSAGPPDHDEPASELTPPAARQVDVLYEHLDDAGLEPSVDEAALRFDLAPCRYHELIERDRATVCAVHARLVQDVLRQADGPLVLGRLEPFVTEHRCRMTLTAKREGRSR